MAPHTCFPNFPKSFEKPADNAPVPRHKVLHDFRGLIEMLHRKLMYWYMVHDNYGVYEPEVNLEEPDLADLPFLGLADDFCNKSIPLYIFTVGGEYVRRAPELLLVTLHSFLYRKWFRPYRSELEWGQFLVKVVAPKPFATLPEMSHQRAVDLAVLLHGIACRRVIEAQERAKEELPSLAASADEADRNRRWFKAPRFYFHPIATKATNVQLKERRFYILQPLFRALALVIVSTDYDVTLQDIATLPVLLVRTGCTEGLSGPISFDTISEHITETYNVGDGDGDGDGDSGNRAAVLTTLGAAVDFVPELEEREVTAYGLQPNPDLPLDAPVDLRRPSAMGHTFELTRPWVGQLKLGDFSELATPSSGWVDLDIYKEWTGEGAIHDLRPNNFDEYSARRYYPEIQGRHDVPQLPDPKTLVPQKVPDEETRLGGSVARIRRPKHWPPGEVAEETLGKADGSSTGE